ncbi:MFS transporter [Plantactinospora sp. WMMB334]|uniref:MFS transporter n=1 Tax=Plantactinospora sp. WMMB334 TaxID=3404119 RepID=UPI003B94C5BC
MDVRLSGIREFRLLWVSGLLAALGAQMSLLALPLLVLRETGSAVQAGAVGTVSVGALLVTMLPGGALADATERLRLLRACTGGSLLVVAVLALAVLAGRAPLPLVLLVAGAGAVIGSITLPATLGLMRVVVPEHLLGTASARFQARSAVARLVGPLAGGAVFAWHPAAPFVVEAAALLLALLCLAFMRTRSAPPARTGPARWQLGAGVAFLWRDTHLRTVLLVFGLGMNAAFSALSFVSLAIASDGGHEGVAGGMVVSLTAAGSLAGALLAPLLHPERRAGVLLAVTCWVCTATAAILMITHPPLLIGLLAAACTAVAGIGSIGFITAMLLATPEAMVGRVQSAASFISTLAQPLGPVAGGALLGAWGANATFGAVGGVFALCALALTAAAVLHARVSVPHGRASLLHTRADASHEHDVRPATSAPAGRPVGPAPVGPAPVGPAPVGPAPAVRPVSVLVDD